MAISKRITSEDLTLNLILNVDKVHQGNTQLLGELYKLDRATHDLENKYRELRMEEIRLMKAGAGHAAQLKTTRDEMVKTREQIERNRVQMQEWRKEIGRAGLTITQLRSHLAALKIQRDNATDPGVIRRFNKEISLTTNHIERMTTGMSRASQAWRHMATTASKYGSILSQVMLVAYGLGRAVFGTVANFRELDKQFSNVMKTTGLTREQVAALKREFDQLGANEQQRTPTSTLKLLDITRIAGKLGVEGVENLKGFTLAVDKLYVALGADLEGSVEEVAEKLGKLVNVFKLSKEAGGTLPLEEAMLRAGSLINELDKRSAASASTILNYTSRLGGVGSMAKFTIDELAGLGAALDAMGVPAERGSTALVKLITALGENAEEFARTLGWTTEEYTKRVKENANGVLLEMIKASAQGNESIIEVMNGMDKMDVSGVRVAETYGKLAQNMQLVNQQQAIAKVAFESSASVMQEFYIMSKDYDSLMALQGKRVKALADDYSKAMAPAMYDVYRVLINMAYGFRDLVVWIGKTSHIWAGLTTAIIFFKSAQIAAFIRSVVAATGAWVQSLIAATVANIRYNSTVEIMRIKYVMLGGGVKGATAALRAFFAAMYTNPLTAIIATVSLLVTGFMLLKSKTNETAKAIADFNATMVTEKAHLYSAFEALKKTTEGTEARKNGIKMINERYGEYLGNLLSEKATIGEIEKAQRNANDALQTSIALKFQEGKIMEMQGDNAKKIADKLNTFYKSSTKRRGAATAGMEMAWLQETIKEMNQLESIGNKIGSDKLMGDIIQKFANSWDAGMWATPIRQTVRAVQELMGENDKSVKQLQDTADGYLEFYNKKKRELEEKENKDGGTNKDKPVLPMSTDEFAKKKEQYETELTEQKAALAEKTKSKKAYAVAEQKLEKEHFAKMLLLAEEYHAANPDSLEARKELANLKLKQMEAGLQGERNIGRELVKEADNQLQAYRLILLNMRDQGILDQETFDLFQLQMEEQYWKDKIEMTDKKGAEYLEVMEKWYEARNRQAEIKAKNKDKEFDDGADLFKDFEKDIDEYIEKEIIGEGTKKGESTSEKISAGEYGKTEAEVARRRRIRKFMGLERTEELEDTLGGFDRKTLGQQLQLLDVMFSQGDINFAEHEKLKTEITEEAWKRRVDIAKDAASAMKDLLGGLSDYYSAQKDKELKAAGDNEALKSEIEKKYARKQQKIAIGQALINGAMAITELWANKSTLPSPFNEIYKGVMTGAIAGITGLQIGAIRSQQFASGRYPVMGGSDGQMYNAQMVGVPRTGIYGKTSLGLFSENKPEMVIDYPTLRNIQINSPALIDAIMAHRGGATPQYAEGKYPQSIPLNPPSPGGTGTGAGGISPEDARALTAAIQEFMKWKPAMSVELFEKKQMQFQQIKDDNKL